MKKLVAIISLAAATIVGACNNQAKEEAAAKEQALIRLRTEQTVRDSLKLDSFKKADSIEHARLAEQKEEEVKHTTPHHTTTSRSTNSSHISQTQANQKKGWSSAAKGAVIGGVGGAIGGAIIDKKKGRGAVIGAAVGAGTGYAIGRSQDRKSGRVKPKQ